jgi:EKC/KEOPS complex subunit CGI121/TPRKB
MESFAYPHFSSTVHVALFVRVTNATKLRARIIRASTLEGIEGDVEREAVNFAFVDARLVRQMLCVFADSAIESCCTQVTSILHIQTAITQAILAAAQNTLRTKTVHSEVIWALNPSNNVSSHIYLFTWYRKYFPLDHRSVTSLRRF